MNSELTTKDKFKLAILGIVVSIMLISLGTRITDWELESKLTTFKKQAINYGCASYDTQTGIWKWNNHK